MEDLGWEIDRRDSVTLIRLTGLLRLADVPSVRGVVLKCLTECPAGIVVDLAALAVTQPVVLTVFPAVLARAARWPAVSIVLAAPSPALAVALRRTAVPQTVPIHVTVPEAIDAARRGAPLGRLRLRLRPTAAAAAEARTFVRDACSAWGIDAVVDEATVIATELTDNAARHTNGTFTLTVSYRSFYLHLAVHDSSPEPARIRSDEDPDGSPALTGKGLRLVDAFATAWGTLPVADGKTTWATLRIR